MQGYQKLVHNNSEAEARFWFTSKLWLSFILQGIHDKRLKFGGGLAVPNGIRWRQTLIRKIPWGFPIAFLLFTRIGTIF